MFGIGPWEIVVIVIVALIFVRPRDLPVILRKAGRFFAELRSLRDDVTRSLADLERDIESSASVDAGSAPARPEPAPIEKPEDDARPPEGAGQSGPSAAAFEQLRERRDP